jgi:hypothetical protein
MLFWIIYLKACDCVLFYMNNNFSTVYHLLLSDFLRVYRTQRTQTYKTIPIAKTIKSFYVSLYGLLPFFMLSAYYMREKFGINTVISYFNYIFVALYNIIFLFVYSAIFFSVYKAYFLSQSNANTNLINEIRERIGIELSMLDTNSALREKNFESFIFYCYQNSERNVYQINNVIIFFEFNDTLIIKTKEFYFNNGENLKMIYYDLQRMQHLCIDYDYFFTRNYNNCIGINSDFISTIKIKMSVIIKTMIGVYFLYISLTNFPDYSRVFNKCINQRENCLHRCKNPKSSDYDDDYFSYYIDSKSECIATCIDCSTEKATYSLALVTIIFSVYTILSLVSLMTNLSMSTIIKFYNCELYDKRSVYFLKMIEKKIFYRILIDNDDNVIKEKMEKACFRIFRKSFLKINDVKGLSYEELIELLEVREKVTGEEISLVFEKSAEELVVLIDKKTTKILKINKCGEMEIVYDNDSLNLADLDDYSSLHLHLLYFN